MTGIVAKCGVTDRVTAVGMKTKYPESKKEASLSARYSDGVRGRAVAPPDRNKTSTARERSKRSKLPKVLRARDSAGDAPQVSSSSDSRSSRASSLERTALHDGNENDSNESGAEETTSSVAVATGAGSIEREDRLEAKRRMQWLSLLTKRPRSGCDDEMSAWLMQVMAVSDPLRREANASKDDPAPDTSSSEGTSSAGGIITIYYSY